MIIIIDRNKLFTLGSTEEWLGIDPLDKKLKSFGFDVKNIDGHSFDEIIDAFAYHSERESSQPLAIIANTIKGKGVSYMENEAKWHYGVPTGELFQKALNEIENLEESS